MKSSNNIYYNNNKLKAIGVCYMLVNYVGNLYVFLSSHK